MDREKQKNIKSQTIKQEKIIKLQKKITHPVTNYRIAMILVAIVTYLALSIVFGGMRRPRMQGPLQPGLHGSVEEVETSRNQGGPMIGGRGPGDQGGNQGGSR